MINKEIFIEFLKDIYKRDDILDIENLTILKDSMIFFKIRYYIELSPLKTIDFKKFKQWERNFKLNQLR